MSIRAEMRRLRREVFSLAELVKTHVRDRLLADDLPAAVASAEMQVYSLAYHYRHNGLSGKPASRARLATWRAKGANAISEWEAKDASVAHARAVTGRHILPAKEPTTADAPAAQDTSDSSDCHDVGLPPWSSVINDLPRIIERNLARVLDDKFRMAPYPVALLQVDPATCGIVVPPVDGPACDTAPFPDEAVEPEAEDYVEDRAESLAVHRMDVAYLARQRFLCASVLRMWKTTAEEIVKARSDLAVLACRRYLATNAFCQWKSFVAVERDALCSATSFRHMKLVKKFLVGWAIRARVDHGPNGPNIEPSALNFLERPALFENESETVQSASCGAQDLPAAAAINEEDEDENEFDHTIPGSSQSAVPALGNSQPVLLDAEASSGNRHPDVQGNSSDDGGIDASADIELSRPFPTEVSEADARENLEEFSKAELKDISKQFGLHTSGSRQKMIDRIIEADAKADAIEPFDVKRPSFGTPPFREQMSPCPSIPGVWVRKAAPESFA